MMYKVVVGGTPQKPKILCFLMPNEDLPKTIPTVMESIASLNEVEEATGLILLPNRDRCE
jgi:hypothetical protein